MAKKGHIPWNKGKKGVYSEEVLKKMSAKATKRWADGEDMYIPSMKGRKHSEEAKKKIAIAHLGMTATAETKKKLSERMLGKKQPTGADSPFWKGGSRKYHADCAREVLGLLGPGKIGISRYGCVHHKDGNYKNHEINNLIVLSRSEHSRLHRLQK